ncbi:MAG: hypothetical protein V7678_12570 [Brevundimonas sp.]
MLKRLFALICAVTTLGALPVWATEDLSGTWIWSVEGRNVFVLDLTEGPQGLQGSLERPTLVGLAPGAGGLVVTSVQMPVVTYAIAAGGESDGGHVLRYDAADPDLSRVYVLRPGQNGQAVLALSPEPGAMSVPLHRPRPATSVFTDWPEGETWAVGSVNEASNPEMTTMFEADQAARSAGHNIDWSVVSGEDAERRARTRELLDAGQLNSGEDFYHAAFIFQHGGQPEDYLLAHVLAVTAISKGHPQASWIAAATLDRYLQNTGQSQIYGTQYMFPRGAGDVTQGDYDQVLLPDAVRTAAGVPTLEEQADQRRQMQEQFDQSSTGD